jgi:hypothetical protein
MIGTSVAVVWFEMCKITRYSTLFSEFYHTHRRNKSQNLPLLLPSYCPVPSPPAHAPALPVTPRQHLIDILCIDYTVT